MSSCHSSTHMVQPHRLFCSHLAPMSHNMNWLSHMLRKNVLSLLQPPFTHGIATVSLLVMNTSVITSHSNSLLKSALCTTFSKLASIRGHIRGKKNQVCCRELIYSLPLSLSDPGLVRIVSGFPHLQKINNWDLRKTFWRISKCCKAISEPKIKGGDTYRENSLV